VDNKELDRFCCNWDIQLRHSSRTIRKAKPPQVSTYQDAHDFYFATEELECYDILIPKDNFHALAEIDQRMNDVIVKSRGDQDYINHMKRKEMIEIKARNNNPAVKKAWDNYSTLMNMVWNEYADRY
jgi:hypothetical protein